MIDLASCEEPSIWIRRGVALLCQLDNWKISWTTAGRKLKKTSRLWKTRTTYKNEIIKMTRTFLYVDRKDRPKINERQTKIISYEVL